MELIQQNTLFSGLHSVATITPRPFQEEAVDETFRLWDSGVTGALLRMATGTGKTITACLCCERWLDRHPNNRCMVISYEKQLVWQFAQEIKDVLNFKPGIEMAQECLDPYDIPKIVVASRQTLLRATPSTKEQAVKMLEFGLLRTEAVPKRRAGQILESLSDGWTLDWAQEEVDEINADCRANRELGSFSRVFKFDHNLNWLLFFDEAHRHAHILASVGHIVDWFDQNPDSRRAGLTATPKRSDNISLKSKMFPGIAIDYPLTSAVAEGWAVPYTQQFIESPTINFHSLDRIAGDFTDEQLDLHLNNESSLTKLVGPLLDLVGDRQTLIFNPSVDMAANVAAYINARVRCTCPCGATQWVPELLLGDGADCRACGEQLPTGSVDRSGEHARAVWGKFSPDKRKVIYEDHQAGRYQFLVVCGLCREGYNDCSISCVAVFRPVTKKASSLAEQFKGRGCRPLKGLVDGLDTAEKRLEAIKNSSKPDCLIVDLVGITGLADCATTASIYAEGLDDEIVERAEAKLVGHGGDVAQALEKATKEIESERQEALREKERQRQVTESFAKRRAMADARVKYNVRNRGHESRSIRARTEATSKQVNYIRVLGLDLNGIVITSSQASRVISQLKSGIDVSEVKYTNHLPDDCFESLASANQKKYLKWKNIPYGSGLTFTSASKMIDDDKQGVR